MLVESTPGTMSALAANGLKADLDPAPGWVVRDRQLVVAVHEPTETVVIGGINKQVAADQRFLNTPTN